MNKEFTTAVITQLDESFIKQWKQLWENAANANIYNSYEWFCTYMEISKNKSYEIHVCYNDGKLVALLPLQHYRCFGIAVYGTLDKEHLGDSAFLLESFDKELLRIFFTDLFKKRKALYLQKIDEKAVTILHEMFPTLFFSLISVNPFIDLRGNPFVSASSTMLSQMKKILRKNEGHIQFTSYNTNLQTHLQTMFALQEESSKKARGMDIFANEDNKHYFQSLTKHCSRFVRINFLYFDSQPVAYEYGFLYKDKYTGEQISYHNGYKKISPGKLIVYFLLDYLAKKDVVFVDQGGGINEYKMQFTSNYRLLYNLYYSDNFLFLFWWKLINHIRRIKQICFPRKHTRDHEFLFKTL